MIDEILKRLQKENIPLYAMSEEQLKRAIELIKELVNEDKKHI